MATGPDRTVTGIPRNPSSGTLVLVSRLTPAGWLAQVVKKGSWPWRTAKAVHRRYQTLAYWSPPGWSREPIPADQACQ